MAGGTDVLILEIENRVSTQGSWAQWSFHCPAGPPLGPAPFSTALPHLCPWWSPAGSGAVSVLFAALPLIISRCTEHTEAQKLKFGRTWAAFAVDTKIQWLQGARPLIHTTILDRVMANCPPPCPHRCHAPTKGLWTLCPH